MRNLGRHLFLIIYNIFHLMQFKTRGLKFFGMKGGIFLAQPLLKVSEPPLKFLMGVFSTLQQELFMTLIQELMNQAAKGDLLNTQTFKRFSPSEIREAIQSLVATEQLELANALGDAGLSLHPNSEDMLAISGLLAMMNQNWPLAVELMDELMQAQGDNTPPFTLVMMVRALRCNLDPVRALAVATKGLALYPGQLELMAEKLALDDFSNSMMPSSEVQH